MDNFEIEAIDDLRRCWTNYLGAIQRRYDQLVASGEYTGSDWEIHNAISDRIEKEKLAQKTKDGEPLLVSAYALMDRDTYRLLDESP